MSVDLLYRYRVTFHRRIPLEPVDDPALLERITVHAATDTEARRAIAWLTGAPIVLDAERLSDEPIALRALPSAEQQLADAIAAAQIVPSPSHLNGAAAFL